MTELMHPQTTRFEDGDVLDMPATNVSAELEVVRARRAAMKAIENSTLQELEETPQGVVLQFGKSLESARTTEMGQTEMAA